MLRPEIGHLLEETDSPYALVIAIAKRARDIVSEEEAEGNKLEEKPVTLAIEEFGAHKYKVVEAKE
ncbi:MAG: DNA-directed RNA polymerase subunit omega [Oscillospiraceae bacterium]|nr:DNA-directed RNA polymerase subunit omega [Oscillospiraceae bacterium]MBR0451873.1 DNA-directed RNA polymerase subunit omega [Oscillospiraceae bacterium]MDO5138716.1 DNA-directed RNA polymerase subunit omega [Oscillospiraceae bacterium]